MSSDETDELAERIEKDWQESRVELLLAMTPIPPEQMARQLFEAGWRARNVRG